MRVERPAPRSVRTELGPLRELAAPLPADAGAEELRLGAPAPDLSLVPRRPALAGAPVASALATEALGHAVARIGPALASGTALVGVDPATAQALRPRLEAVRRMASVVADLIVLGDAAATARRATRTA